MSFETIVYSSEERIGLITLNRPERLNAISPELDSDMMRVLDEIDADDEVRVVMVTGGGRAFSAGADISDVSHIYAMLSEGRSFRCMSRMEELGKPIIGVINGIATGGGLELALGCDLRIASDKALFGLGEVKLGVIPAAGGTQRLPRLIGATKAKEMLFFGDLIDAQEAYRVGLVNKVVPADSLMSEARAWAKALSQRAPLAMKAGKASMNIGTQVTLQIGLNYEAKQAALIFNSEDRDEGMNAFFEKREPVFKGK